MLKYRYNEIRERMHGNWKLSFWPPFCFEMNKVASYWPLDRLWKRDPVFYFCRNRLSGYWSGDLKFVTDSLPLFRLNDFFFLKANSEASMMWDDAMPYEMNEFTKKSVLHSWKNTTGFVKKNYNVWQRLSVYLQSIKATRAYLRLV